MSSLFADTHNVVAIIEKSDAAKGFEQIIDFLSRSYIHYALTVSPHIYISCIKQFWNSVSVKRSGDVTRLQALVDKKKIVISEAVIREILQLNDAEGVVCLPNEEIFAGLAQMGLVRNVDNSSKFYMYPRFIQLIIQAQVGDLSTHTTRFNSPTLTQKVFANMRRVRKGFLRVETPLFKGMIADRQPAEAELEAEQVQVDAAIAAAVVEDVVEDIAEDVAHVDTPSPPPHATFQQVLDTCSALLRRVEHLEHANVAQRLEIVKLKARVKKLEQTNKVKPSKFRRLRKVGASRQVESSDDMEDVFNQGRMMHEDEGIELEDDSEVQDVVKVVTTAKLMTEVVAAAASQGSAASATILAVSATIPIAAPKIVAAYTRRRKGVIIRDPEEELPLKTPKTPVETPKVKDKDKGILVKAPKPMKKKDQIEMDAKYARKLQEEIDRDHDGFNKDKAAKRRKLSEEAQEAEDLRKRLEVVEDEDDDVFVEATPLAQKVPVVDYQIVLIDNKPRYKIIRADDTHQLYISFTTLLKNFDREDLETLWRIVRDRFSTSKPTNFSDEYLLLTLKTMFKEPDGQDAIWRNQKSVHGLALVKRWKLLTSCGVHVITLSTVQLFLLVERRYPLSRFTLEQLVNVTRLQVEEENRTVTTLNELDLQFSPMFDKLLNGSSKVVSKSSAVSAADAPNQRQHHTTPLKNHTTPAPTCQVPTLAPTVTTSENINQAETYVEINQVADDEFINIFSTPVQDQGETSSRHVDLLNMHTFYQRYPS
nr:hypothetical protein [Tanacetum cinerariifolium]